MHACQQRGAVRACMPAVMRSDCSCWAWMADKLGCSTSPCAQCKHFVHMYVAGTTGVLCWKS